MKPVHCHYAILKNARQIQIENDVRRNPRLELGLDSPKLPVLNPYTNFAIYFGYLSLTL